ncbi:MAG: hypothetical protein R3217_00905 [Gammaproteobacteria bacterium]|nr:hypothetical protein [Gammaproteobacteria bacterium]
MKPIFTSLLLVLLAAPAAGGEPSATGGTETFPISSQPDTNTLPDEGEVADAVDGDITVGDDAVELVEAAPPEPQFASDTIEEIQRLTMAGAPELALDLLGEAQASYDKDPEAWRNFERLRVEILRRGGRWERLIAHLSGELPSTLSLLDQRWTQSVLATALVAGQRGEEAIPVLRGLIWSDSQLSTAERMGWQRLLIRAYEQADLLDEARMAIQRYQQDYELQDDDWTIERARLALRVMAPEEAVALLQDVNTQNAQVLRMIGKLWSGATPPEKIVEQAVSLGVDKNIKEGLRREAWAVAAEAADMLNSREARIAALERGLILSPEPGVAPIIEINADALWDAYVKYGERLGNQEQLIVGEDEAWFLAASNRYDKSPVQARALFAVVARQAFREDQADIAHWQLASLLDQRVPSGGKLMQALYLDSEHFPTPDSIPPAVRYLLVNHVLAIPDIPLASKLVRGLEQAPEETDPVEWHLRRARVLLLGGAIDAGIDALQTLFGGRASGEYTLDRDRVLQVVFDLQTLGRHAAALRFFHQLSMLEASEQARRELHYWIADSLSAMGRHADAAREYLRSALLFDPYAADPWAQTSKFRAGEEMVKAGLYGDARVQFQGLLNATRDPGRKAVLRNHLQQVELLERGTESRGLPQSPLTER